MGLIGAIVGSMAAGSAFIVLNPSDFSDRGGRLVAEAQSAPFTQVVPSWNFRSLGGSVKIELQAVEEGFETKLYSLGVWSKDPTLRTSIKDQADENGDVWTDTLALKRPAARLRVILTPQPDAEGRAPELKQFFLSFTPSSWAPRADEPFKAAWGRELKVPERAQHDYPGGNVLCSPTCISMLMNRMADRLDRNDLRLDVPELQQLIHDPAWGGTGNWPFNTAAPGSFGSIQGFVTRLNSLSEAERFVAAGLPIAVSVDYKQLLQKTWDGDGGHLIVLIGFTAQGDPIVNDPAKGKQVRQVYPRARFAEAWASSKFTIYVVRSLNESLPAGGGPWPAGNL